MTNGFCEIYDGNFEQWMAEEAKSSGESMDDSFSCYCRMFHKPFYDIENANVNISEEELRRWINWCIFYGKPREKYPPAMQD